MKVHAIESCVVGLSDGTMVTVTAGEPFNRSDPVVREHKWLFDAPVEQATAAPGEKRATRRG